MGEFMRKGFLIDMDGVIYRGRELIPGAAEFIASCGVPDSVYVSHEQQPAHAPRRGDEADPHGDRR